MHVRPNVICSGGSKKLLMRANISFGRVSIVNIATSSSGPGRFEAAGGSSNVVGRPSSSERFGASRGTIVVAIAANSSCSGPHEAISGSRVAVASSLLSWRAKTIIDGLNGFGSSSYSWRVEVIAKVDKTDLRIFHDLRGKYAIMMVRKSILKGTCYRVRVGISCVTIADLQNFVSCGSRLIRNANSEEAWSVISRFRFGLTQTGLTTPQPQ